MQETHTRTAEKVRKSREKRRPKRKGIGSKTAKSKNKAVQKPPLEKTPYLPPRQTYGRVRRYRCFQGSGNCDCDYAPKKNEKFSGQPTLSRQTKCLLKTRYVPKTGIGAIDPLDRFFLGSVDCGGSAIPLGALLAPFGPISKLPWDFPF